jgi:transposase
MPKARDSFYQPPSNGAAIKRARREQGLDEEIALLRVKLKQFVEQERPDEGLILSTIDTLGRALMAQARLRSADPATAAGRARAVIRHLGGILKEEAG